MSNAFSRRTLLKAAGAGAAAAAAAPLLSACSNGAAGTGSVSNVGAKLAPWPTYVPAASNYSLPALPNNGAPAELAYPSLPLPASVSGAVGDGSGVSMMTFSYGTAVDLGSGNRLLAALNKATNLAITPTFVPETTGSSYTTAMSTMQASGDLADLITVGNAAGVPEQSQFIEAECADLTEYLSGDAIKQYPNLAAIPTRGWELMGRINGKIYGVPVYRYNAPNAALYANSDAFKTAGIWTGQGLSVAEFAQGLSQVKSSGKVALGATGSAPFGWTYHLMAAGAPYNWAQSGGDFTLNIESPAFRQGLENLSEFYGKGLFNADALTATSTEETDDFLNGSWASYVNGTGGIASVFSTSLPFTPSIAYPYGPTPGVEGGDLTFCFTVIKKSSPDRIKMLLRLLDFLSAPFGTKEWELVQYGVEGVHFTRGADGSPAVATKLGSVENSTNMPFKYLALQPQPLFLPGKPKITQAMYEAYKPQMSITVADASLPYLSGSATYNKLWSGWTSAINQTVADVVSGKQALSGWSGIVSNLKQQFQVEKIKQEFAQAYAAAH